MNRLCTLTTIAFALAGCGDTQEAIDMAVADAARPGDLGANGHCKPSTPPSLLSEGPCALAPPNGYCFLDIPEPGF